MEPPARTPCSGRRCLIHLHSVASSAYLLRRISLFTQVPCPDGITRFLYRDGNNQPALLTFREILTSHFRNHKAAYERLHGSRVRHLVGIIPASTMSSPYLSELADAAIDADMNILLFIPRAVLAAGYYGLLTHRSRNILVLELGHELQISLLQTQNGYLRTEAAVSDLGCPLFNYLVSVLPSKLGIDLTGDHLLLIRRSCEHIKNMLCSGLDPAASKLEITGRALIVNIHSATMVGMNLELVRSGIRRCLTEAGVGQEGVDDIALAGASATLPEVLQVVREFFERQPFICSVEPGNVINMSGALYIRKVAASLGLSVFGVNIYDLGLSSI